MLNFEERVPLNRYSTLHVGGSARYFARVITLADLKAALSFAEEKSLPWFILGGGANFFCRDDGFPGLVIKMENRKCEIDSRHMAVGSGQTAELTVGAGVVTRLAVLKAVAAGLRGLERLAGIPGTIGGAVRGNAGAFGTETKDFLTRVQVLRRTTKGWAENALPRDRLFFAYRDSTFKRAPNEYVLWGATFALPSGERAEGERRVHEDLAARKAKQPYDFPSVGSIFKNPSINQPAGKLIEAVGLKGVRVGGAQFSEKHANFIVNRGGATAREVLDLIAEAKKRVSDKYEISLEEEIVVL